MLSFKHRSGVYFPKSLEPERHRQMLNTTAANCSLQIPSTAIPITNIKLRERFLVALAVDYLCRWRVSAGQTENKPSAGATILAENNSSTDSALALAIHSAAFYGAIEQLEKRNRADLVSGVLAPLDKRTGSLQSSVRDVFNEATDVEMIECKNKCLPGSDCAYVHDWSTDASEKQYFTIKNRPHVLVQYVHPCNHGAHIVPIEDDAKFEKTTSSMVATLTRSSVGGGARAPNRDARNALMNEILSKVNDMRKRTDGESLHSQLEHQRTQRAEAADAQRRRDNRIETHLAHCDARACNHIIQRARDLTPEYSDESTEHDDYYEDSCDERHNSHTIDDDVEEKEREDDGSSELDGQNSSSYSDSDEESDTFSDEDDSDDEENTEEQETEKDNIESELPATLLQRGINSAVSDDSKTDEPHQQTEQQQEQEQKRKVCRQTTVEMMVGICEPSDSIALFDELELPYIVQWASADDNELPRRKLHLYRKTPRQVRGWVYNSTENVYHWLGTIEALI